MTSREDYVRAKTGLIRQSSILSVSIPLTSSPIVQGKLQMMMLFAGSDTTPRRGCEGHSRHGQTLARPQRESEAEGQRGGQHPTDDRGRLWEAFHGALLTFDLQQVENFRHLLPFHCVNLRKF